MLILKEKTQYLVANRMLMLLCHVTQKPVLPNQQIKNGYTKFKSFPDCDSKEVLHYIEPTLETYDSAILLNDKSPSSTDNLVSNLVNIVNKCKSFRVMDLFASGIAFNKRLPYTVIKKG